MKRNVVALTGGIGSGKSCVARILSELGFDVVDCDILSRQAAQDEYLLLQVSKLLGQDCILNGSLNRPLVRQKIFADEKLYQQYSALFWNKIQLLLEKEVAQKGQVVFVEIPVLEAFPFGWSEIWLVESEESCRIRRVAQRDGVPCENVLAIMSKQAPCKSFTRKISNNGTLDDLKLAVLGAVKQAKLLP